MAELPDEAVQMLLAHMLTRPKYEEPEYAADLGSRAEHNDGNQQVQANKLKARRRHSVGACITTCKRFLSLYKDLELQVASQLRAARARAGAPVAAHVPACSDAAYRVLIESSLFLKMCYSRLFVLAEPDSKAPKVTFLGSGHYTHERYGSNPRDVTVEATLVKQGLSYYIHEPAWSEPKDLYVASVPVAFSCAASPPEARVTQHEHAAAEGVAGRVVSTLCWFYMPDDVYTVAQPVAGTDRSLPGESRQWHGYTLPPCLVDALAPDAIVVGSSGTCCWYEAVGPVRMGLL